MNAAVGDVSAFLGNTPAVCRSSYIDPRVFDRYRAGVMLDLREVDAVAAVSPQVSNAAERAVLELLDGGQDTLRRAA